MASPNCTTIEDFEDGAGTLNWVAVNDGVMGGRSSGGPTPADGALLFTGTINTNGGGFSSIRASLSEGALAGHDSVAVTVTGDGRPYGLILQTDTRLRGRLVNYRASFETTTDRTRAIVPASQFVPTIFGRVVPAGALKMDRVQQIGIILADGTDGPFSLQLHQIEGCSAGG